MLGTKEEERKKRDRGAALEITCIACDLLNEMEGPIWDRPWGIGKKGERGTAPRPQKMSPSRCCGKPMREKKGDAMGEGVGRGLVEERKDGLTW